jgi:hypothetical protein
MEILMHTQRWFSKFVIEMQSPESDDESDSSADEVDKGFVGRTYHVHKGSASILPGGMREFEVIVGKRVEKRMRDS